MNLVFDPSISRDQYRTKPWLQSPWSSLWICTLTPVTPEFTTGPVSCLQQPWSLLWDCAFGSNGLTVHCRAELRCQWSQSLPWAWGSDSSSYLVHRVKHVVRVLAPSGHSDNQLSAPALGPADIQPGPHHINEPSCLQSGTSCRHPSRKPHRRQNNQIELEEGEVKTGRQIIPNRCVRQDKNISNTDHDPLPNSQLFYNGIPNHRGSQNV